MTRLLAALLAGALLAASGGARCCGAEPYRLTAIFSKAPSLYEQAR